MPKVTPGSPSEILHWTFQGWCCSPEPRKKSKLIGLGFHSSPRLGQRENLEELRGNPIVCCEYSFTWTKRVGYASSIPIQVQQSIPWVEWKRYCISNLVIPALYLPYLHSFRIQDTNSQSVATVWFQSEVATLADLEVSGMMGEFC